ncbi:MAG: hypothetical protein HC883_03770 [Bdellovibrionaceae bacterium]|nr:hypothetical protein [Pseudobdellovibrionaceae bacterium]
MRVRGGQKLVIAADKRNLLAVSQSHNEYEITPPNLQSGTVSAKNAAAELLEACKRQSSLDGIRIALAYPAGAAQAAVPRTAGVAPAKSTVSQAARPATRTLPAPSYTPTYTTTYDSGTEQGGAAR